MERRLHLVREKLTITKIDAARGQLRTAISLWFTDGDPVSIHTLAFAAYSVIHHVSKDRNRPRDLLSDSRIVKEQHRREWYRRLARHANFFKHADNDPNETIVFDPELSEHFIMYAIAGIALSGERHSTEELAFMLWFFLHRPELLSDQGHETYVKSVPADQLNYIRSIPRDGFLDAFRDARRMGARMVVRFA